ncbi:MAG: DUF4124 domain-containing protein [Rhodocyclaceae bacterium]
MQKLVLASVFAMMWQTAALADIYKCVDSQGRVTYTNDRSSARGCTPLSRDLPVSSIPSSGRQQTSSVPAPPAGAAATSFPRVTPDTQRERDDSRRRILMDELAAEEASLLEARKNLDEQESIRLGDERNYQKKLDRIQPFKDKVALHERNIEALRKEIGNLR